MKVSLKIIDSRLKQFPLEYATPASAGVDCRACIDDKITLYPGEVRLISLGFAMQMDNENVMAVLLPRSGLGHKNGIVLGNLIGVLDVDYQGTVMASLWNRHETQEFPVQPLDRICQMVIVPIIRAQFHVVEEFSGVTQRGVGGFNSTGVK